MKASLDNLSINFTPGHLIKNDKYRDNFMN